MTRLLSRLNHLKVEVNKSTGFHVHLNMGSTSLSSLKRIAWNYYQFEPAFELLVSPSRRQNNKYCKSNRDVFSFDYSSDVKKNRCLQDCGRTNNFDESSI
eukprot:UN23403